MHNEREFLIEQILAQQQEPSFGWPGRDVNCPDVTLLMADALGQAAPDEKRLVEEHCARCEGCRTLREEYRGFRDDADLSDPPIEGSLLEKMAEPREFQPKREPWPWGESMPQPAGGTPIAQGTVSGFTQMATNPARWPELLAQLQPWLPFLLRRAGLPEDLAGDFLVFLRGQLPTLGERRFREALPGWLEAFARERVSESGDRPELLTIEPAFVSSAAVEQVLGHPAANETPWAAGIRREVWRLRPATPTDLLSIELSPELTSNPALPAYLRDLFLEARGTERAGLELFELATTA